MDDLVKVQQNLEHWRQEVGKLHSRVATLTDQLTRANAATAASYEQAAGVAEKERAVWDAGYNTTTSGYAVCEATAKIREEIRALTTAGQTAALDRVIAEAVCPYVEALRVLIDHTHECERELTEALYHADFCGESRPLTDARAILAASKKVSKP